ncbi:MAG: hypothetical protein JRI23_30510 [Deltaproteobacteria bacterium]|jgi:hypothetical protein|nr:hypothetical protein [Deltaproteobacteria bacterium]MBW2536515.1 hypothetical protein [Deltaproteobacteria bacterium]
MLRVGPGLGILVGCVSGLLALGACDGEGEFVAESEEPDIGRICAVQADCDVGCVYGLNHMAPYCTQSCAAVGCPEGYYCVGRAGLGMVCAMGRCESDADCPPEAYRCNTDHNVCQHVDISCGSDADCPTNTACNQGVCTTVCRNDDDCKQGTHCNIHVDTCMACAHHAHCDGGYACDYGVCGQACVVEDDCRPGYRCTDHACELIEAGGPGTLGTACSEDAECEHFCYHSACRQMCDVPNGADQCPEGFYCEQFAMICQPQG